MKIYGSNYSLLMSNGSLNWKRIAGQFVIFWTELYECYFLGQKEGEIRMQLKPHIRSFCYMYGTIDQTCPTF